MGKSDNYYMRQCKLQKTFNGNTVKQFSWLPEKYAKKGRIVDLKTEHGWEEGWEVIQVFDNRVKASEMRKRQDDYKNTRKASDI